MAEVSEGLKVALYGKDFQGAREVLRRLTSEFGWREAFRKLKATLHTPVYWFDNNLTLLPIFKMEELVGYDGVVSELLDSIPETHDFNEVESALMETLIEKVRQQLSSRGSTLLFNTDMMKSRATVSLIPDIASARKLEMERVVRDLVDSGVFESRGRFDPTPLLLTSYGLMLLEKSGHRNIEDVAPELQKLGKNTGFEVPAFPHPGSSTWPADGKVWKPRISKELAREVLKPFILEDPYLVFESETASSEEFIALILDESKEWWQVTSDLPSDDAEWVVFKVYPRAVEHLASLPSSTHRTELLIRTLFEYIEDGSGYYRSEYHSKIHKAALTGLRKDQSEVATGAVMRFLNEQEWRFYGEERDYRYAVLPYTKPDAFDLGLEIAIERGQSIEPILEALIDCLEYPVAGGITEVVARRFVQVKGLDAFDSLIGYLGWYHPEIDFSPGTNEHVFDALATLGPAILPKLKKHLWTDELINRSTVALMETICKSSKPLVDFVLENAEYIELMDMKWLIEPSTSYSKGPFHDSPFKHEVMLALIGGYYINLPIGFGNYDNKELSAADPPIPIEIDEVLPYLWSENEFVRFGACMVLFYRPDRRSIPGLSHVLRLQHGFGFAVEAALRINDMALFDPLMDAFSSAYLNEYPNLHHDYIPHAAVLITEWVLKLGLPAVRLVSQRLSHDRWEARIGAIALLELVLRRNQETDLVRESGLDGVIWCLSQGDSMSTRERGWSTRPYVLGKCLPFQVHSNAWDVPAIASAMEESKEPWLIINFIRHDATLMADSRIRLALEGTIPHFVEALENPELRWYRIRRIVLEIAGIDILESSRKIGKVLRGKRVKESLKKAGS